MPTDPPPTDHIRYDVLAQEALRGLVRQVLADAARVGLPGEHHFFITFDTKADGVRLSPRLRQQYPETMTIVLQHQFRDLKVNPEAFEVGLSFGGVPERLSVPFSAIKEFVDPSVQFALQFQASDETAEDEADGEPAAKAEKPAAPRKPPAKAVPAQSPQASVPAVPAPAPATSKDTPADKSGAEVVRLDRFRKK